MLTSLTSSHFAYWTTFILACQALNAGYNIVSAISPGVIHPRVIHVLACLLLQSFLTGTFLMCLPPLTGSPNRVIMSLVNFLNSVIVSVFAYLVTCLTYISGITTSMSFALTIAFVTAPFILWSLWYQIIFCNVKYTNVFWVNNNIIFPPKMLNTEWLLCNKLRFTIRNSLRNFTKPLMHAISCE